MHTVIYDTGTRAILALDPQTDDQGNPILPNGISAAVATISNAEAAKIGTPQSSFTLAADGKSITVTSVPVAPPTAAEQQRAADAATLLNAPAVRDSQAHRDAFARLIGVKPLSVALAQDATPGDIQPL